MLATAAASYLDALNPEQRRAVEHGAAGGSKAWHHYAGHCRSGVRQDQHPRSSRRPPDRSGRGPPPDSADDVFAARRPDEISKRVERIARKASWAEERRTYDGRTESWRATLSKAGRWRAPAARARAWRRSVSTWPTIRYERADPVDPMNLVRHEKAFSKTESRFPGLYGTCLDLPCCVNAEMGIEQVIGENYIQWCSGAGWG